MSAAPSLGGSPFLARLEQDPAVICLVDRSLRITYCNPAWDRFALDNEGEEAQSRHVLGRSVLEPVPEPLRPSFEQGFAQALSARRPFELVYQCHSPEIHREFRLRAAPGAELDGLLLVHSLVVAQPHEEQPFWPSQSYVDRMGYVMMCCHCRRTRRVARKAQWDWVPGYLADPPRRVTHGLCEVCQTLLLPQFA